MYGRAGGACYVPGGDVVLCKVNGRHYLHLVKAIQGKRFQIGNNRGRINGLAGLTTANRYFPHGA